MATQHSRAAARLMISPAVILLFLWMAVPLGMTIYFSFLNFNLLIPSAHNFIGLQNYDFFVTDPAFVTALVNTLVLVLGVLVITTVGGGWLLARSIPLAGVLAVTIPLLTATLIAPASRRFVTRRVLCVMTRHRLPRVCFETRMHTRSGRLPPLSAVRWRGCRCRSTPARDRNRARGFCTLSRPTSPDWSAASRSSTSRAGSRASRAAGGPRRVRAGPPLPRHRARARREWSARRTPPRPR